MTWPTHAAADLFPLLEGEEFAALVDDVRANGLHEPVWLYEDPDHGEVVLDGRNRARACEMAGVQVRTRYYRGNDPIGFTISENVQRRHLTTGQRADIGLRSEPLYAAEAAKRKAHGQTAPGKPKETLGADRPEASDKPKRPRSRDQAAKTAGTSGRAVARMKRITEQAPDLADKVRSGVLSLDRADRIIRDRQAEQRRVEQARHEAAAQGLPTTVDIRLGDFRKVLADLRGVDAVITDPPYGFEYLPLLGDLAAWADKVLAPDGVLVVLMGQTYLPEVFRLLDGHRPYRWTACYLTPGNGYAAHHRSVHCRWKPLLVYGAGSRFEDLFRSEGQDLAAKANHRWGQDYGAFHTIVERLTERGQTVVDPFMGSGTTLLAAHALGRHAIGCDMDDTAVAKARERLT